MKTGHYFVRTNAQELQIATVKSLNDSMKNMRKKEKLQKTGKSSGSLV